MVEPYNYFQPDPGEPHCIDDGVGCLMEDGHCVRTVHAEANAIAFAARKGVATEGATMYVTITPCKRCADIMKTAGIADVVFFEDYRS